MLADECASCILSREEGPGVEGQTQRSGMRSNSIIRHNRPRDQIRPLRADTLVDMLAVVAVRPAVEPPVADRRDIIWNEIAADFITLVDGNPEGSALRLPGKAVRVA